MGVAFVGRDVERAELDRGLDAALDGRGGVVLLAGEPGIGKTALCDQLASRPREGRSGEVGSVPRGNGCAAVLAVAPGAGRLGRRGPDADRFMVFEARTEALRELAAPAGLVAIFDDLHWADEGSLRLLVHAATSLRVVARPRD